MTDPIPARLAALKTMPLPDLKEQWRALFGKEPPGHSRRFLESRLSYRIQELAYGGLKPETVRRLEALGEQLADRNVTRRRIRHDAMPIAGTRLIREWRGSSTRSPCWPRATSGRAGPIRSLSAIARAITGTRWNGLVFFGLRKQRRCGMSRGPEGKPIRKLRCAVYTRKSTEEGLDKEFNSPAGAARSLRGVHRQPAVRGLVPDPRRLRRRRLLRWHAGAARRCSSCSPTSRKGWSTSSWSTRSTGCRAR